MDSCWLLLINNCSSKSFTPGYERLADDHADVEAPVILLNEGEMIDSENSGDEVNDLTPRANDVTPRANDVTPRANDVTPRADDVTLNADDVVPQSSDMNDNISAPNEEKLAKNADEAQDEAVSLKNAPRI